MIIPYPKTIEQKTKIIEKAKLVDETRNRLEQALNSVKEMVVKTLQ